MKSGDQIFGGYFFRAAKYGNQRQPYLGANNASQEGVVWIVFENALADLVPRIAKTARRPEGSRSS